MRWYYRSTVCRRINQFSITLYLSFFFYSIPILGCPLCRHLRARFLDMLKRLLFCNEPLAYRYRESICFAMPIARHIGPHSILITNLSTNKQFNRKRIYRHKSVCLCLPEIIWLAYCHITIYYAICILMVARSETVWHSHTRTHIFLPAF